MWRRPGRALGMVWLLAATPLPVEDQPAEERTLEIGVLFWHESPNDQAALVGIQKGLEVSGTRYRLLECQALSDREVAVQALREWEERPVDLIFAMGTEAALIARDEVEALPVVFTAVTHPVESGVVPSWESSGRNLAGNSNWIGPRTVLQVFRLAVPGLERLGILRSAATGVVSSAELRGMQDYLAGEGAPVVTLLEEVLEDVNGIEAAARRLHAAGAQAIWVPIDFLIYENMAAVAAAAQRWDLPLVSSSLRGAQAGAIAGVLVDYDLLGQRAVVLALQILREGREPASLAIGTMSGYQVVVNLEAARAGGYPVPLSLLAVADRIIDANAKEAPR